LPPAGSTSRSRPPPSETRCRRDPCGRARTALSVRANFPFALSPRFYTTTIFCLPGFCWDAMGCPNSKKPTAGQWVSGVSGTSREPSGIPVLDPVTERVSVYNGPDRLLWEDLGRWGPRLYRLLHRHSRSMMDRRNSRATRKPTAIRPCSESISRLSESSFTMMIVLEKVRQTAM
jgi:hypothetical protein